MSIDGVKRTVRGLDDRLSTVVQEVHAVKADVGIVTARVTTNERAIVDLNHRLNTGVLLDMSECLREFEDRDRHEKNLIVFGATELKDKSSSNRITHDKSIIQAILT